MLNEHCAYIGEGDIDDEVVSMKDVGKVGRAKRLGEGE